MRKTIVLLLLGLQLMTFGCSRSIRLIEFETGKELHGKAYSNRSIKVTLEDGRVLKGSYSPYKEGAVSFGSATGFSSGGIASALGQGVTTATSGTGYAILTDQQGLVMEILFTFSGNHGFGNALTNKGEKYKVIF